MMTDGLDGRQGRRDRRASVGARCAARLLLLLAALPARARRGASHGRELPVPAGLPGPGRREVRDLAGRPQRGASARPGPMARSQRQTSTSSRVSPGVLPAARHDLRCRGPLAIRFDACRLLGVRGGKLMLPFDIEGLDGVPDRLTFDYSVLLDEVPGHRGFLIIEHNWATGTFANEGRNVGRSSARRRGNRSSRSPVRRPLRGFLTVMWLGTDHIWKGLDHVVFLFALLLPAVLRAGERRWRADRALRAGADQRRKDRDGVHRRAQLTLWLAALGVVAPAVPVGRGRSSPARSRWRPPTSCSRCSTAASGSSCSSSGCSTASASPRPWRRWGCCARTSACRCSASTSA